MRPLILVAVIFHLAIIVAVESQGPYQVGDIISFPRKCIAKKGTPAYKHFAIYVGPESLFGQGADKDIFHRIRERINGSNCVFGSLEKEKTHRKENYLDHDLNLTEVNQAAIIDRIQFVRDNCGKYKLLKNNCEHLATYVRYGIKSLKQPGTIAGFFLRPFGRRSGMDKAQKKIKEQLEVMQENVQLENECEM